MTQPRIVSLVPSLTEMLCTLGLREQLVGRTGFCVHPRESLRAVPKVGGTKDVDVERVRALAPTHLVANIDENDRDTVEQLAAFVPRVMVTHPIVVEDNLALFDRFGAEFAQVPGVRDAAAALSLRLREALDRAHARRFEPLREALARHSGGAAPHCATIDGEMTSWYGSRAIDGLDYLVGYRERLGRELDRVAAHGGTR